MATPTLTRCPVHHQPASLCSSPELADAIDTLRDLDINPALVDERHMLPLDDCGGCEDRDGDPETAVLRISYTTRGGVRHHTDACPLCLDAIVRDRRGNATDVRAYIPIPAGAFGSAVSA